MEFTQQYMFVAANKTTESALKLQLSQQFTLQSIPREQGLCVLTKMLLGRGQGRGNDFQGNTVSTTACKGCKRNRGHASLPFAGNAAGPKEVPGARWEMSRGRSTADTGAP